MMEPIDGKTSSKVATHALPAFADGFFVPTENHEWRFSKNNKVDSVM